MIRNYPVRTCRHRWKIHIHSTHSCTIRCQYTLQAAQRDETVVLQLIDNPLFRDGRCHRADSLVNSVVRLATYERATAMCSSGRIHRPDDIVIPDRTIKVEVKYPLEHPADVSITSVNPSGFSLRELIHQIKKVYRYIYQEEERTATPSTFNLSRACEECSQTKPTLSPATVEEEVDCSVCCEGMQDSVDCVSIRCGHTFHRKCIDEWLDYSRNCPLCRKCSSTCTACSDTGVVFYDYNGVVLPRSERGIDLHRNHTDGRFGIGECDFHDLYLYGMTYDRRRMSLSLLVNSILIYAPPGAA
jgi:hypothetical protein